MSATIGGNLPNSASIAGLSDDVQLPGSSKAADGRMPEKTISCVSCRKRKLKCDRTKPTCSTCSRLRHECEYPERRRNLGSKRRNMKELEARLAQVETQLVGETKLGAARQASIIEVGVERVTVETDWDALGMDMNIDLDDADLMDPSFNIAQYGVPEENISFQAGGFFSQELIGLGLQEPLPPQDMMDNLFELYFERFHPTMPMMHKARFYASLDRAPNARPPVCLRYAMWTMAASLDERYTAVEELLYERSRKYVQEEEMKGHGEAFISIYHAQTWGLIASYEAKKTYFSRSWMSSGRMIRLVHMLGLDRLDHVSPGIKTILPPAKDVIEREERRRTFWGAFYADRWSSSGTGWPMIINEQEIKTNLPCSEYSFEHGIEEPTSSLSDALNQDGASRISPFSGVIMSATLFGHNFQHLHRTGPNENPDDLQNGEFWKRHRKMDNVLSNTFMFLPDQLRLPSGLHDMNVVFLNLNIHTSAICLHQAAVATATKHKLDQNFIKQSQARCIMAADEITNVMRLTCHVNPASMHSWVGFCLYIAAGIYVKNQTSDQHYAQALPNLEFLLIAMRAIGRKHSITKHFIAQLELDIEAAGLYKNQPRAGSQGANIPNLPINGLLVDRHGVPMTIEDIQGYHTQGSSSGSERQISNLTPASDVMNSESRITSAGASPDPASANNIETAANPALIPENYFPGAKTPTQWTTAGVLSVPGSQGPKNGVKMPGIPDVSPFLDGPNTTIQDNTNPAGMESFIQGMSYMTSQEAQQGLEGANSMPAKSPSNDNHTMRFPYRQAIPDQQTNPLTGGLCPWADADPSITNEWARLSGFDENQNLNPNNETTGSSFFQTTTNWVPDSR